MSIIDTFDPDQQAIFNPEDAYHPIENFPETVLVTFTKRVIDIVKNTYDCRIIATIDGEEGLPIYQFQHEGKDYAIYRVTMGAAGTVALQEEVIVMGGKRFIYFGSCGTLDAKIPAGSLIVPTEAYRDEGTSYHYMPSESDFVSVSTANQVSSIIENLSLKAVKCKCWTTDALFRETRRNMQSRVDLGCRVVDMECSAIHAAGQFRHIPIYQFFFAEDNLDAVEWDPRICGSIPKDVLEFCLHVALKIGEAI